MRTDPRLNDVGPKMDDIPRLWFQAGPHFNTHEFTVKQMARMFGTVYCGYDEEVSRDTPTFFFVAYVDYGCTDIGAHCCARWDVYWRQPDD